MNGYPAEMPQLNWNEYEFVECLEVLPAVEYSVEHRFVVQRAGIELVVTVWQLESIVKVSMRQIEQQLPLIEFVLVVRDRVRHLKGADGSECLEFLNVLLSPRRGAYSVYPDHDVYSPTELPGLEAVRLFVKPAIRVELQRHASFL